MSAFTRTERPLLHVGVQLTRPPELCDPGKWPISTNLRSPILGTICSRAGMAAVEGAAFGDPVHTLVRYDDSSPFAGDAHLYFIGVGDTIYSGDTCGGSYPAVDSGYSGSPLSTATATPPQSPQPWLYVADPARNRKFDANGHNYRIGLMPPRAEAATELQELGTNIIEKFDGLLIPWVVANAKTTLIGPVNRVNTSVNTVLYDENVAPSYASIVPYDIAGITEGMILAVGSQIVAVTQVTVAVVPTTVAAIQFDSGSTGMCTIQPADSLGTGQLQGPSLRDYQTRFGVPYAVPRGTAPGGTGTNTPPVQDPTVPAPKVRILDFPVNCVVRIGSEHVRIHNIAIGPDGVQSFRCFTFASHSVGETITGVSAFRGWVDSTVGAGTDTVTDKALSFKLTGAAPVAPATSTQTTGGLRTGAGWAPHNLALIGSRATQPEDDIYLAIRADNFTRVQTVRVFFSVEKTAGTAPDLVNDFTQNYFYHEWRQSDIVAAIQAANAQNVSSLSTARATAQANAITDRPTTTAGGSGGTAVPRGGTTTPAMVAPTATPQQTQDRNPATSASSDATSQQLALGNNQWIPLHCKVQDLIQIGTDMTKTLANVTAAEVLVSMTTTIAASVTIDLDALWLAGGFPLDVGAVGNPYVWRYRYRSSMTGARSVGSPPTRGGIMPKRQHVMVTPVPSSDPQVDLVDVFRMGGGLTAWTYVGTIPNDGSAFDDRYDDAVVDGGETLEEGLYPPFPCEDIRHTGTCNVAGSSVTWVSGDQFDVNWQAGSLIIIDQHTYLIYGPPDSPTRLFTDENVGAKTGVPFVVPAATLIDRPFGSIWAGSVEGATFLFGCRDPIDPGMVHWSNGNDVETASDKNTLQVTDPSEPLQAGFMFDGISYVASTENLYRLYPTFGTASTFVAQVTPCGRGFWTPWAWCLAPEGVYFVAKDGIFLTAGGSPAVSITDGDLYPLFPHEGVAGQAVNGYKPVAMYPVGNCIEGTDTFDCAAPSSLLRLVYIDGWVKFDYPDITGERHSLCYHVATKAWYPDVTTPGINMRAAGVGQHVHQEIIGGMDGRVYLEGGADDNGAVIHCHGQFVDHQGDVRRMKLYRDVFIKGDLTGALATMTVGFTDNTQTLPAAVLTGLAGLRDYLIDVVPKTGVYGTNLVLDFQFQPSSPTLPRFQTVDIAYQPGPELASSWLSGPTTLGSSGFKQIPRALICYTASGPVTLSIIIDGVLYMYDLPSTGGIYAKNQVVLQSVKGKTFQFGMQGAPFQLFDQDVEIWTQPWGQTEGYQILRPF